VKWILPFQQDASEDYADFSNSFRWLDHVHAKAWKRFHAANSGLRVNPSACITLFLVVPIQAATKDGRILMLHNLDGSTLEI
jgi:hypothetical protein